jgi:hypothetical protein
LAKPRAVGLLGLLAIRKRGNSKAGDCKLQRGREILPPTLLDLRMTAKKVEEASEEKTAGDTPALRPERRAKTKEPARGKRQQQIASRYTIRDANGAKANFKMGSCSAGLKSSFPLLKQVAPT